MIRFVLVALLFAVLVYLLVRVIERRNGGSSARLPGRPGPKPTPRRAVAPDDDEQFLRDLDKKRKDEPPTQPG